MQPANARGLFSVGLGFALLLSHCGSSSSSGPPNVPDTQTQTDAGPGDTAEDTSDVTGTSDTPIVKPDEGTTNPEDTGTGGLPADFNAPCQLAEQCETGFCIDGAGGRICTITCLEDCPEGWSCQGVNVEDTDLVFLCVPEITPLCSSCETDEDCGTGAVDACQQLGDEGRFCLQRCGEFEPCPTGYSCEDQDGVESICVPETESCICTSEIVGTKQSCHIQNEYGLCAGYRECVGAGGWGECDALEPAPEVCDEIDNNCNGVTDEQDAEGCQTFYEDKDGDGFGDAANSACLCTLQGAFTTENGADCNDLSPAVKPGGTEYCNGFDDDCDGLVDSEGAAGCTQYYRDADGDGWGVHSDKKCLCIPDPPYTVMSFGDCNDDSAQVYPGSMEFCNGVDDNCNGFLDEGLGGAACTITSALGACSGLTECQGALGIVCSASMASLEICDGQDNDCDGAVDEADSEGCSTFFEDKDFDGYGNVLSSLCLCQETGTFSTTTVGDCNDLNPQIAPGALETCNALDDDCNGTIDDDDSSGCLIRYRDFDGDGWGDVTETKCVCQPVYPYTATAAGDCNDGSNQVFPGAVEICNSTDDNCNGLTDEDGASGCVPYFLDADGDGYGVTALTMCLCGAHGDWSATKGGDCDDSTATRSPGEPEVCDDQDNNCNGFADEACDKDSDGYCDIYQEVLGDPASCPKGAGDCNDFDSQIYPTAGEICDSLDNDCDGEIDEGVTSPCGGCGPVCVISAGSTGETVFDGYFNGTSVNDDGHVELDSSTLQLTMIWVANSGQGTISKINTLDGREVARYQLCSDPSRTSVDADGNCWIGCRGDGRVGKVILAVENCDDKNGNGVIDTSVDSNDNGVIDGGEMLGSGSDECVQFIVQPDGSNTARAVGVDKDNHAWVGMWDTSRLWKLHRDDGSSMQSISIPTNPYGIAIDQTGIIWISGRGNNTLVRVDPNTGSTNSYSPNIGCYSPYGIAIDENGRVWTANYSCWNVAYRFDPVTHEWLAASTDAHPRGVAADGQGFVYVANDAASRVAKIDVNTMATVGYADLGGGRNPVGVAVDFSDKLWAVNQSASSATRIDTTNMNVEMEVPTGPNPYTYSDMTGYAQKTIVAPAGTFRQIFEGWEDTTTKWLVVELSVNLPGDTSVDVRVRSAEEVDELEVAFWSPYFGPFPPESLPVNLSEWAEITGRFLEVEIRLHSDIDSNVPILQGIDVIGSSTP